MKYPVVDTVPVWNNPTELGLPVSVDGTVITAVPSQDAVTGDVIMGASGFEADDPYVLCNSADLDTMGDLHGKVVIIGAKNYKIRNVRPKPNIQMTRLVLMETT